MEKISRGKNRRTKERRHRNMSEARAMTGKIAVQIQNATSEEERKRLMKQYNYYSARSTRKANQL